MDFLSLWELMTPGAWPVGAQGLDWHDLCRGPLNIATYKIYKLWASWKKIFSPFNTRLNMKFEEIWPSGRSHSKV